MNEKHLQRIARRAGVDNLVEMLAERLSATDLQSLLLAVYARRVAGLTPARLTQQLADSRFVQPAGADPRALLAFDQLAFGLLPAGCRPVELSPVAPLGVNAVVAHVSQNNAVSTSRNNEVLSDSTNMLALLAAQERRQLLQATPRSIERVWLAASQRLLRPQNYAGSDYLPHFRLFGLVCAGRNEGGYQFEQAVLAAHLRFYLRLLARAGDVGFAVSGSRVTVTDWTGRWTAALQAVLAELAADYPATTFAFDPERAHARGYYDGLAFHLYATNAAGDEAFLADGGLVDWTGQLLSDRQERLLISGFGSERFVLAFGG